MDTDKIFVENLVNEYSQKSESKIIALKKLDKKAKRPADIFAYTFGILSSLIMGVGTCLSMNVIGKGTSVSIAIGIIIGIIGLIFMGINYPIYIKIKEKYKQKYAFDIIELAKEINDK